MKGRLNQAADHRITVRQSAAPMVSFHTMFVNMANTKIENTMRLMLLLLRSDVLDTTSYRLQAKCTGSIRKCASYFGWSGTVDQNMNYSRKIWHGKRLVIKNFCIQSSILYH